MDLSNEQTVLQGQVDIFTTDAYDTDYEGCPKKSGTVLNFERYTQHTNK